MVAPLVAGRVRLPTKLIPETDLEKDNLFIHLAL